MQIVRVSVVIPHLNTPTALVKCLRSVSEQRLDNGSFETIVVDNGSHSSLEDVARQFPDVHFFSELTPGPGPARNLGVGKAKAAIVAFIDADCRAEIGWLQAAVDAVERRPDSGVIGGDVKIDVVNPQKLTSIEAYESVFAFRQQRYIQKEKFSGTGNLAMSRTIFDRVGPFAGIEIAEDIDWGRRACLLGYPATFNSDMIIYHPSRDNIAELQTKWRRQISHFYANHRNAGRSLIRWYLGAVFVLLSIFVHAPKMLFSNRLAGFGNRLVGIGALVSIRIWRSREMIRISSGESVGGASSWNRA